jgi:hypothetical protein
VGVAVGVAGRGGRLGRGCCGGRVPGVWQAWPGRTVFTAGVAVSAMVWRQAHRGTAGTEVSGVSAHSPLYQFGEAQLMLLLAA